MEHVGIVVDDLEAAAAFFVELGLEPQGEGPAAPPAFGDHIRAGWITHATWHPRGALRRRLAYKRKHG